jgi:hypothetical protein
VLIKDWNSRGEWRSISTPMALLACGRELFMGITLWVAFVFFY